MNYKKLLLQVCNHFNNRNIEGVLAAMSPDVSWPNGWQSIYLTGKKAKSWRLPLATDDGFPDHRLVPWDITMRDYHRLKTKRHAIHDSVYGEPAGCEALRTELSRYLRETRAIPAGPMIYA